MKNEPYITFFKSYHDLCVAGQCLVACTRIMATTLDPITHKTADIPWEAITHTLNQIVSTVNPANEQLDELLQSLESQLEQHYDKDPRIALPDTNPN